MGGWVLEPNTIQLSQNGILKTVLYMGHTDKDHMTTIKATHD